MKNSALFPGSFDPFTIGHLAVAVRGLSMFDHIIIGVGKNVGKNALLAPEKRAELIECVFEGNPRVKVVLYEGLTGDFCRSQGIVHILRGLRDSADFVYEHEMEMANTLMYPEITTVGIFTPSEYIPVSSRLVREIIAMGGNPAKFLPEGIDIKDYL